MNANKQIFNMLLISILMLSRGSIGESYGSGYTVSVLHKWLERVVIT